MANPSLILAGAQTAGSIISGLTGSSASRKAAKKLKEIGKLNYAELMRQAEVEQDLGTQEIMNLLDVQAHQRGVVEGMYSKSGVLMTGTPAQAMREMEEDFGFTVEQAEESIDERVRRIRFQARMALEGAELRAEGYEEQAKGDILGAVFGGAKGALSMFSAWGGGMNQPPQTLEPDRFDPSKNYLLTGFQA